mmetsp:Transcript_2610/g.3856  ORF Transcript_2610/g.3856 Transcript_2610/m.3856 type:complete len:181 (+) Transcript_2610:95-637(+)
MNTQINAATRSPYQDKHRSDKIMKAATETTSPSSPALVSDFPTLLEQQNMKPLHLLDCFDDGSSSKQNKQSLPFNLRPKRSRYSLFLSQEEQQPSTTCYIQESSAHEDEGTSTSSPTETIDTTSTTTTSDDSTVLSTPKRQRVSSYDLTCPPAISTEKEDIQYPLFMHNEERMLLPLLMM